MLVYCSVEASSSSERWGVQSECVRINTVCVMLTEISNPFQQLRAIFKTRKEEHRLIFKVSELSFAAIFSLNRGFIGTLLVYNIWTSDLGTDLKLCVSAIYAIGLFWIYIIASLLFKRMRETNKKLAQPYQILSNIVAFFKKKLYLLIAIIFVWSFLVPILLTQVLEAKTLELKVGGFILV
mmetsp:Transcript_10621/g.20539  ORF Transcript_10621/g.20539 Transcript_10621/m.20539 type:complete len:181 (+) Transcript_10621:3623-4165(+)